ncbi:MAG: APC family permease [Dehalococcoidia bacterium]
MGPGGGVFIAATVAISTFGCNASAVIGMSRVCYAMAADGMFLRRAAAVHPVYRTPHVAVVLSCTWASLLALSGTYEQLYTYVTFASILFFVLGGLAVFRLRRIMPDGPRPYRTWGYPIVPALFVLGSGVLVVNTLVERPAESLTGLALVALGLPVYWYFKGRGTRTED